MPIRTQNELPAKTVLENENIFVMDETRALGQDIRPLKIAILNLMPLKIDTETQLSRLLGNSPLQVELELKNWENAPEQRFSVTGYQLVDSNEWVQTDGLILMDLN